MRRENKTTVRPNREKATSVRGRKTADDATARIAAREAYRAKIELLLDESKDDRLADVWQRVCPFPIDPAGELPDRRGMIADLADFAEVLRPNLRGMQGNRLCGLIEKYAACEPRLSGQFGCPARLIVEEGALINRASPFPQLV